MANPNDGGQSAMSSLTFHDAQIHAVAGHKRHTDAPDQGQNKKPQHLGPSALSSPAAYSPSPNLARPATPLPQHNLDPTPVLIRDLKSRGECEYLLQEVLGPQMDGLLSGYTGSSFAKGWQCRTSIIDIFEHLMNMVHQCCETMDRVEHATAHNFLHRRMLRRSSVKIPERLDSAVSHYLVFFRGKRLCDSAGHSLTYTHKEQARATDEWPTSGIGDQRMPVHADELDLYKTQYEAFISNPNPDAKVQVKQVFASQHVDVVTGTLKGLYETLQWLDDYEMRMEARQDFVKRRTALWRKDFKDGNAIAALLHKDWPEPTRVPTHSIMEAVSRHAIVGQWHKEGHLFTQDAQLVSADDLRLPAETMTEADYQGYLKRLHRAIAKDVLAVKHLAEAHFHFQDIRHAVLDGVGQALRRPKTPLIAHS